MIKDRCRHNDLSLFIKKMLKSRSDPKRQPHMVSDGSGELCLPEKQDPCASAQGRGIYRRPCEEVNKHRFHFLYGDVMCEVNY